METEYAPGRAATVLGTGPTVLLWHGSGPDERDWVRRLAEAVAARGRRVVAPDWDSTATDGGRSDLLTSLRFARESAGHEPVDVSLVGWSRGGIAAASVTLNQRRLGLVVPRTVCVAAAPFPRTDPISGAVLGPAPRRVDRDTTVAFVTGLRDERTPVEQVRTTGAQWNEAGWPTTVHELDADHFTIIDEHADAVADVVVGP